MVRKKVVIIGSGFSSLSASCYLAKAGYNVTVFEKNSTVGGRARVLQKQGFKFDIGPTWYWMPDVFEKFFNDFNKSSKDFYELDKLAPAYMVYFEDRTSITIQDSIESIFETFEKEEPGSSRHLKSFMNDARENYEIAINDLVYNPGESLTELISLKTIQKANLFVTNISATIRKKIKSKKLIQILEFPVLFLGAKPANTPGFYNFMNYADFGLGTWHPKGGMYEAVKAFETQANLLGVKIKTNQEVKKIRVENKKITGVEAGDKFIPADIVLCGADYHHGESLLEKPHRMYSENYWKRKTFAPSALLFYVGFDKKLTNVTHHTLFFDSDFEQHAIEIYDTESWPKDPLFYASFPSKTDTSFAPEGMEAATFLIPIAPGLSDSPVIREKYFSMIIRRFEELTDQSVMENILFKESYCVSDFVKDYNSYKGNAYGLANTLKQTAYLRPKIRSKKVVNLYFTGQLTVPGPGVPPAIISGKIVADLIQKVETKRKEI